MQASSDCGKEGLLFIVASNCDVFSCHEASVAAARGLSTWQFKGPRAQTQELRCMGVVALWHVGSSWTRDQTPDPCIGRQMGSLISTVLMLRVVSVLHFEKQNRAPFPGWAVGAQPWLGFGEGLATRPAALPPSLMFPVQTFGCGCFRHTQ